MTHTHSQDQSPAAATQEDLKGTTGTGPAPSVGDAAAESVKSELAGEVPDAAIPDFVEYTKAVAVELGDKLQQPVTLESLMNAKLAALEFCVSEGWAKRLSHAALKASGVEDSMLDALAESALAMMPPLIEQLKEMAQDVPAFLKEYGVAEQQVMESPQVGLNDANLQKYKEGSLTIAELYMTQPSIIIKNSA